MLTLAGSPFALHDPIGHNPNPKSGTMPFDPTTPIFRDAVIGDSLAFNLSSAANFEERHYNSLSTRGMRGYLQDRPALSMVGSR